MLGKAHDARSVAKASQKMRMSTRLCTAIKQGQPSVTRLSYKQIPKKIFHSLATSSVNVNNFRSLSILYYPIIIRSDVSLGH